MEKRNTKELILQRSLDLFSVKGFEGVSVREIAKEVGIKESSLYKHYKSKEDIFNSIMARMAQMYNGLQSSLGFPENNDQAAGAYYETITRENLLSISKAIFLFYLKDEFAARFRRMLTIEQYKNTQAGAAFRQMLIDGALDFQSGIFAQLINAKAFIKADPYVTALAFYAPVFLLLCKYDNQPEREQEALTMLVRHVDQFSAMYSAKK